MNTNFLQFLRQQNIYGGMPSPPPQFNMPGIYADTPDMINSDMINQSNPVDFRTSSPQFTSRVNPSISPISPTSLEPPGMSPDMDAGARMKELYNPSNDAGNNFQDLIDQYPQRNDPSWLRRIASMVVDYTKGPAQGKALFEGDFRDKQEDWKNKIGPSQQAANLERYENTNQRTLAYNQIAMELREKAQLAKDKLDTRNAEIRQQRADIYDFKARNPNLKLMMTKGGNVMAFNPGTGQTTDTGIPTGSMTEIDKINLGQEHALEQIGARGNEARETEGVRQENRLEGIQFRGDQARQTRATPQGGTAGKPLLPTQVRIQQFNKAREILNSRPDLAPFIKLGTPGANDFEIEQPSSSWFGSSGPTPEQSKEINSIIYGGTASNFNSPTSALTNPTSNAAPNFNSSGSTSSTGSIRVSKNGKTGTFKGTVAEAQAAGYTVIGQ